MGIGPKKWSNVSRKRSQDADIPTQGQFYTLPLRISPRYQSKCYRRAHTHESRSTHGHFREIPEPGSGFAGHWRFRVVRPFADVKTQK
jgi:hypothetical protein